MTDACIQLQAVRDIVIHVQNGDDQISTLAILLMNPLTQQTLCYTIFHINLSCQTHLLLL